MTSISFCRFLKFVVSSSQGLVLPRRQTPDSPGIDLYMPQDVELAGREEARINLSCRVAIPAGYFGLLVIKASAAQRHKLAINNPVIGEKTIMLLKYVINY